jgi:lipopolysaccharide transport system ATP-binding protein
LTDFDDQGQSTDDQSSSSVVRRSSGVRADVEHDTLWALRDVSFEVKRGEVVGIIGRNGAGKSTLLKMLARITYPTSGRAVVNGRVGSLLEVGTGFHPELTGRENIYLNGTILGMTKAEVDRKFDEIVDFSGVEKFIDTPVKRYSSGMRVRLAFSVAAHLEPEILLIDEVLAVGDAQFQKKCLGKMGEVAKSGRTVIFVSHNMAAVKSLCQRCIVLSSGQTSFEGATDEAIASYAQQFQSKHDELRLEEITERTGSGDVRFAGFYVEDGAGEKTSRVFSGESCTLVFGLSIRKPGLKKVDVGFSLHTPLRESLTNLCTSYQNVFLNDLPVGYRELRCELERFPLAPGRVVVRGRITVGGEEADWPKPDLGYVDVEMSDFYGTSSQGQVGYGPFLIRGKWSLDSG